MSDSLLLDPNTWDLTVDAYGNIATCGSATPLPADTVGPLYCMAQDVATRLMAWQGEVYYDTTQGIPYQNLLGSANVQLLQSLLTQEALKVSPVVAATAALTFTRGAVRGITGDVFVSNALGQTAGVTL